MFTAVARSYWILAIVACTYPHAHYEPRAGGSSDGYQAASNHSKTSRKLDCLIVSKVIDKKEDQWDFRSSIYALLPACIWMIDKYLGKVSAR